MRSKVRSFPFLSCSTSTFICIVIVWGVRLCEAFCVCFCLVGWFWCLVIFVFTINQPCPHKLVLEWLVYLSKKWHYAAIGLHLVRFIPLIQASKSPLDLVPSFLFFIPVSFGLSCAIQCIRQSLLCTPDQQAIPCLVQVSPAEMANRRARGRLWETYCSCTSVP